MEDSIQKPMIYVLAIIKNEENKILFEYRSNSQIYGNQYALIGGKVEKHESLTQALIRELTEEIDIVFNKNDIEFTHVMHFMGKTQPCIFFVFNIKFWTGSLEIKEKDKSEHLCWFAFDKLPENVIPRHKKALELISKKIIYSEDNW